METVIAELKETIARRPEGVVMIVGAGATMASLRGAPCENLASWGGLLQSGLERAVSLRRTSEEEAAELRAMLAAAEPERWIAAAEAITAALGGRKGGEFAAWLRATAGRFAAEVRERAVGEALRGLCEAGVLLATVNYDGILEAATGLRAVTWREPVRVERVLRGDERGILHLHGYWEDPGSVVFGRSSYEEVRSDAHAWAVLTALRMQKTLVLVGHGAGLDDPNWGSFLRWTEAAFAGSEYRHYRLVRAGEQAKVQASHPAEQRIVALPYGETHAELAPFLRSLVPARTAAAGSRRQESTATQTVVILVNVLEKDWTRLTEEEVRKQLGEPGAIFVGFERRIDPRTATPRTWREIARAVDRVAAAIMPYKGSSRFVVCGRAPLPVFAYLGRALERSGGEVTFLNCHRLLSQWDRIPISPPAAAGPDHFTQVGPLSEGSKAEGRVLLAVLCAGEYRISMEQVAPVSAAADEAIVAGYGIQAPGRSQTDAPMTEGDLPVLNRHVEAALAWIAENVPNRRGVVVALAGPAWVAFWLGQRLNPRAGLGRVDFRNFDIDTMRYVPALSSPRHAMPWLWGRPRVLFLSAEPARETSIQAEAMGQTIEEELAALRSIEGAGYEVRVCFEVRPEALAAEIRSFRPDVLHLYMHGSTREELAFEGGERSTRAVSHELFVRTLVNHGAEPTAVVMSSCHSALLASALEGVAECVVTARGELKTKAAIGFAGRFYGLLAAGESLMKALRCAQSDLELAGTKGYEVIEATSAVEEELEDAVLFRRA